MPTLRLERVKCITTTSGSGDDDVYIEVEGQSFWGGDAMEMGEDDTQPIGLDWPFQQRARVVVYEWDEGADDVIGGFTARPSDAGQGEQRTQMTGDGGNYEIYWTVT